LTHLDANVFVRWIARDDPAMTDAAEALFARLQRGEEQVEVLEAVIAEVIYVLTSRALYALPRGEVAERLQLALTLSGISMDHKSRCLRALELYVRHRRLSFVDALVATAALEGEPPVVYSFDRDLDRVVGLTRREPVA
jgi:predicted nucleic acid-binding protein